jgi:hypothetical protein
MDPDGPQERDLTEPITYSATVLTKDFGAVLGCQQPIV